MIAKETRAREKKKHRKIKSLCKKMDAQYSHILLFDCFRNKTDSPQTKQQHTTNDDPSIQQPHLRIGWKQRRVSPRHVADSKKSAAHPLCNEFSEFPAHNQSTSARPPFPPTFRLIYRRRHHRLHHHLLRYIADVVRQASARIASCSPREFKSGQCAVNAASFTTVGLLRSSADVTPPVASSRTRIRPVVVLQVPCENTASIHLENYIYHRT